MIHSELVPAFVPAYTWDALYNDGTHFAEYSDKDGRFVQRYFKDIEAHKCTSILLTAPGRPPIKVALTHDMKPVFFRRHSVTLYFDEKTVVSADPICIVGFVKRHRGKDFPAYVFVYPDGGVLLTEDFQTGKA